MMMSCDDDCECKECLLRENLQFRKERRQLAEVLELKAVMDEERTPIAQILDKISILKKEK